ncbi:hypothetical protein JNK13_09630 [bacterium]|nr:hypothetical protein [bacterium]
MLEKLFKDCGLNQGEQEVLTYLLTRGPRGAAIIAKGTSIKRPTVYSILENLIDKNLVRKTSNKSITFFSAVSTQEIPKILQANARSEFERVSRAAELMTGELKKISTPAGSEVIDYSVLTYDSPAAAWKQHFEFASSGGFCAIFNPNIAINEHTKQGVLPFLKTTSAKRFKIRELAVDGPITRWYVKNICNPHHHVKILNQQTAIISNIIMRDGVVNITHYTDDGLMTIKIDHPDFFETMQTVFELQWQQLDSVD